MLLKLIPIGNFRSTSNFESSVAPTNCICIVNTSSGLVQQIVNFTLGGYIFFSCNRYIVSKFSIQKSTSDDPIYIQCNIIMDGISNNIIVNSNLNNFHIRIFNVLCIAVD